MLSLRQMKKARNKSPAERDISYQKPVLRSEAFARALSEAKLRVVGAGGLRSLFERAAKVAASLPKQRFKENWPYLQTMLRLVGAYERGQYKQVSSDDLMWIVAALNYLVDPFDLIPDKTPLLGFVDDAIVVGSVVDKTRQALDDFMIWETNGVSVTAAVPPDRRKLLRMHDELRKQLAAEFMQRTADGTLVRATTRLLVPGGIHHDWRFAAGWDSFLKAVAEAHRMSPQRRIEIKHLLCDGDFVIGHVHVVQRPGDPGAVGFFLLRFEGERIAEMWAVGQALQVDSPNKHGAF